MASAELSWTEAQETVNQIAEYQIFRATKVGSAAIGAFVLIGTNVVDRGFDGTILNPVTDLLFSDGTVDFSTEAYQYRIDAIPIRVGESRMSLSTGSVQTPPGRSNIIGLGTPPSAPVLSGVEGSDIILTWTASTPALNTIAFYTVFRSVNGAAFVELATVPEPLLTFTDTDQDPNPDNTLEYKVTATDEVGISSADSNTVGFGFDVDGFIAIANSGASEKRIMTSEDGGVTWVQSQIVDESWQALAFARDKGALGLGRIVALNSASIPHIYFSDDGGDTWTPGTTPLGSGWTAVTYSQSLGLFAAISNNAVTNGNKVMTSSDGITWAFVSTPAFMDNVFWSVIHFDPVNALFLCGSNGTAASSSDGITFTERTTPGTTQMGDQIATDAAGLSVADNPSDIANLRTLDGTTWIDVPNPNGWAGGAVGMAFGAGLFVASIAGPAFETSPDGTANWINRSIPVPGNSGTYAGITFSSELGLFVAVNSGNFPNQVVTSVDGINWVVQDLTGNIDAAWRAVIAIKRGTNLVQQEMVMVETDPSAPRAGLSVDGFNWSTAVNGAPSPFRTDDVAYSPILKLYVSVGDGFAQSSPDGINWTTRTVTAQDWQVVYWDDVLLLFIAAATESGTNQIMTSPDGIVWTDQTVPNNWRGFHIVSDGSGRVVACGFNASLNPSGNNLFSDDAITWSVGTDPTQVIVGLAYDTSRSRFVQMVSNGECNVSSDGQTWSNNINGADVPSGMNTATSAMTYSADLDLLVQVGSQGIFTSGDGGVNWVLRESNDFQDVVYSVPLGKFFACNSIPPLLVHSVDGITWFENPDPDDYDGDWSGIALGDVL